MVGVVTGVTFFHGMSQDQETTKDWGNLFYYSPLLPLSATIQLILHGVYVSDQLFNQLMLTMGIVMLFIGFPLFLPVRANLKSSHLETS